MLKRTRSSLCLGLSETDISLLLCQNGRPPLVLADGDVNNGDIDSDFVALKDSLDTLLTKANRPGVPVRIILADRWVRYFMVTPPLDARAMEDCQSAAAMRFKSLFGESMDTWHLAADWDARHPFLACAMPKALFAVLQAAAAGHRLTLTGLLPHFVVALNRWRHQVKDGEWFATMLDRYLTLGQVDQGRLTAIRSTPLSDSDLQNRTWLAEYAERESMRMNWPEPNEIQLSGEIPESWLGASAGKITLTRCDQEIGIRPMNAGTRLASCGMPR